ncbi:XrtA/PEP-CTERM system histidine kinase PrsK [Thiohalorhabdus sp.]|uniref:XrtA/PEP-CTERM system histidine kinase PrsK n=1 Tax=Thiohalorhabdus sp. TaxID=3094134 RepID=UPI002FC3C980
MVHISAAGFLAAALAFLAVATVLAIGWRRGRATGGLLLVAVLVSALWGAGLAGLHWADALNAHWVALLDALRLGGWLAFLLSLVRLSAPPLAFRALAGICGVVVAGASLAALSGIALPGGVPAWGSSLPSMAGIAGAVLGLVLLEQVYRNTREEGRWALKHLFLAVGTLLVFDLFLFADALLMRVPDFDLWAARGYVNALLAPLIAVAAARNPEWNLDVYVSRRFVLHTASLMGAGVYLLVMALAAYSIRIYGGAWGGPVQFVFLVGSLVLLLVVAFSGQIQARMRVFFSKHFFNYRYDYREEWLRFTRTLTAEEGNIPLKQRVIQAVAQVVESPGGMLWQERDGFLVPTALWNMSEPEEAQEPAFGDLVSFLEGQEWILTVDEWRQNPEWYGGLDMPPWLAGLARAWLLVPLLHRDRLQGFLVLARSRAGNLELNWEDFDLLRTLGRQAASYLAQEEAAEALGRAQQFETFNRLSAFVLHDLKNIIGQLSMLARNARRHADNPEFMADAVTTIEHSVGRMNQLMAQLRGGVQSDRVAQVDLAAAVQEAAGPHGTGSPEPKLDLPEEGVRVEADRGRLIAVLGHVIQNARDATPEEGSVRVALTREGEWAQVDVVDSGTGMDSEFVRERLFRPFDTSKGDTGMGIGAYEAREYARELGGDVEVYSASGKGTRFRFRLPASVGAASAQPPVGEVSN